MQVYIGIDWSEKKHDVVFMNAVGGVITRLTIEHSLEGFGRIEQVRQQLDVAAGECLVGMETAHNILIEYLWQQGYSQIYVILPKVTKSSRGRYGSSGARTDQGDATLLADLLRTDRARLQLWQPDSVLLRRMAAQSSLVHFLTGNIVRTHNRLRETLLRYYPAAVYLFSKLCLPISLEFIRTYPTPADAEALTLEAFREFARQHRYPRPARLPARYARLQRPWPQANEETVLIYQAEAQFLAELLLHLVRSKQKAMQVLQALFQKHPDALIFTCLPGAGDLLAPSLLVKFGEDRQRFPTPQSVQTLAGTCPVTISSGKRKTVRFRFACDRRFRTIAQQWAMASLGKSGWANEYFQSVLPHCRSNSHAYRCLANRWLAIAWKLWQSHQTYDETYHLKQRALRRKPH